MHGQDRKDRHTKPAARWPHKIEDKGSDSDATTHCVAGHAAHCSCSHPDWPLGCVHAAGACFPSSRQATTQTNATSGVVNCGPTHARSAPFVKALALEIDAALVLSLRVDPAEASASAARGLHQWLVCHGSAARTRLAVSMTLLTCRRAITHHISLCSGIHSHSSQIHCVIARHRQQCSGIRERLHARRRHAHAWGLRHFPAPHQNCERVLRRGAGIR